jgi:hypothetical protein
MDEERMQTISIRVPEETYERLKRYAEDHGESVSDVLRRLIDGVLSGGEQPAPSPGPPPGPGPVPQPGPAIPAELLELPGKVQQILAYEVQMQQHVGALAWRMGELQRAVLGILAVMFPGAPLPPWGVLSAVEKVQGLAELAQASDVPGGVPGTE